MIPTGYAQVGCEFESVYEDHNPFITFGVDPSGLVGVSPALVGDAVDDAWASAAMGNFYTTSTHMIAVHVKFGPDATGPSAVFTTSRAGTAGGAQLQPSVAMLVHKQSALGGRPNRGRFYTPHVPASYPAAAGSDMLSAGTLTGLQPILDDFLGKLDVNDIPMVLLHGSADTPTAVTGLVLNGQLATQRRRMR